MLGLVRRSGWRSMPMRSISISIASPAFIHTGGVRAWPTPAGVPITITSPGSSVMHSASSAMVSATLKIMSLVFASCITWPFRRLWMRRPVGAGRQLVGGDQHRAEAAGGVEVLADGPLRRALLVVAHRHVVEAAVAEHVAAARRPASRGAARACRSPPRARPRSRTCSTPWARARLAVRRAASSCRGRRTTGSRACRGRLPWRGRSS